MNKRLSYFQRYATLRNALIAFVLLQVSIWTLHQVDQPLRILTPDESKLDLQSDYDVTTVMHIFDAYGERGRAIYAWDLLVDTIFPLALTTATILFLMTVMRRPLAQKLLIAFPVIFVVMDIIENALFLIFLAAYPSVLPTLVRVANLVTRIKLFAIYPTWIELYLFMSISIFLAVGSFLKHKFATRRSVA